MHDLDELIERHSLLQVCGLQWLRCVEHAVAAANRIRAEDWIEVRYEQLVHEPMDVAERLMNFLELDLSPSVIKHGMTNISAAMVGSFRAELDERARSELDEVLGPALDMFDYAV